MKKILTPKVILSACIYLAFSVYLYYPHFRYFRSFDFLVVFNTAAGALGCFLLSKRWIYCYTGSFIAGLIYGFSPFMLELAGYHPTAGLLAAGIPWLFCPAAFRGRYKSGWLSGMLALIPFAAIICFFYLTAKISLFAVPLHERVHLPDLVSLVFPIVTANSRITLIGFYHVPVAALIIGLLMMIKARRYGVMVILAAGSILSFSGPVLNTSPLIWLSLPVLCCSILIGVGIEGLLAAGFADRKWLLICTAAMTGLSIASLLLANKYLQGFLGLGRETAQLLTQTAGMYIMGLAVMGMILFFSNARLRAVWLRIIIIAAGMAIDIFFGATFMVYH